MSPSIPKTMKAAVIDRFGGPEVLHVASMPVPEPGDNEVLVRVSRAGVGVWDPWLREGGASGRSFPLVLGSDGSGTIAAIGPNVQRFKVVILFTVMVTTTRKGVFTPNTLRSMKRTWL